MSSLHDLVQGVSLSGVIQQDAPAFLIHHGASSTAYHVRDVAMAAARIAGQFEVDPQRAEIGGWLHDISTVIPNEDRMGRAREWGIEVLTEEEQFPMILHQKLSVVMARELFGVKDEGILSAIGCHTTLKRDATVLDKVVFIADKIAWDQPGAAPFLGELQGALMVSLDAGCKVYLRWLWDQREKLRCVHPWFVEAYQQMVGE